MTQFYPQGADSYCYELNQYLLTYSFGEYVVAYCAPLLIVFRLPSCIAACAREVRVAGNADLPGLE